MNPIIYCVQQRVNGEWSNLLNSDDHNYAVGYFQKQIVAYSKTEFQLVMITTVVLRKV